MKKVTIIGATGMLGSMVYNVLKDDFSLVLIYKDKEKLRFLDGVYGGIKNHKTLKFDLLNLQNDYEKGFQGKIKGKFSESFFENVGNVDAIINCGGIINTRVEKNWYDTLFLNGVIPHILSNFYKERFIHITTDCVFNGKKGSPYYEDSLHSPVDFYGLSKEIGEPSQNSLVLRTSIIGPEIANFNSLLEWVRKQKNKTIYGYTNHLWNGVTTKEFGNICKKIISKRDNYPKKGIYHIFSTDISKYEMVKQIALKYNISVNILPREVDPIDRRLGTIFNLNKKLNIPSFSTMLAAL